MAEHTALPWEVVEMIEDHPGLPPRINIVDLIVSFLAGYALGALGIL